jgi:hypothetical protein
MLEKTWMAGTKPGHDELFGCLSGQALRNFLNINRSTLTEAS